MKKIAVVAALAMSGLIYKTADAQIAVNLGLHFGSHRDIAPVARIAMETPVYQINTMVGYYGHNDRYDHGRDAYRGREQRYDNRAESHEQMDERNDQHYDRRQSYPDQEYGGRQHAANGYNSKNANRFNR